MKLIQLLKQTNLVMITPDADAVYDEAIIVVRQSKEADSYYIRLNLACNSGI